MALVKMTIPVTDNSRVQDSPHSNLALEGKSNKILACIRNTQNNKIAANISWDRNKSYQNFFQLAQDVLTRFALSNTLMCVQNVSSTPTDNSDFPNLTSFQFAQCVERNMQYKYTVIVDFEPYLHELLNLPRRELFQRLKRKHSLATKKGWIAKNETSGIPGENSIKIYNVHLSLLKAKSFVNQKEEPRLCTFTLQGRENETIIVEPAILHYKQLTSDSQHTHLKVDIKNPEGHYPSFYTGALSLQLRLKAFEDEWYQDV